MTAPDPLQTVLTILSTDWTDSNTDSITPEFQKITSEKRINFNENQDWVFAQRSRTVVNPAGIGDAHKHEVERFELDIRVNGSDQESHFYKVIEEVKRIIEDNKISPSANYTILEFDGSVQDLSDRRRQSWRALMDVQLFRYNVAR